MDGVRRPASSTCAVTSKLKALGGCSSHHLQGAEAYCDGPITDRRACSCLLDVSQTQAHNPVIIVSLLQWPSTANHKNITCSCVSISKSTTRTSHVLTLTMKQLCWIASMLLIWC